MIRKLNLTGKLKVPEVEVIGRSVVYAVSVNCLYRDRVKVRVRDRVSGRVTDRVRVRHPDSSGNVLIRRKLHYARSNIIKISFIKHYFFACSF